jgi:hypothetical protein
MPVFSSEVPSAEKTYGFDLKRTPEDRPLERIILSEDLIGSYTHWFHGRTMPCEGDGCPACKENCPSRWHGYVACFDPKTHDSHLFEFTLKAAASFKQYRETYGTLRGCFFRAFRPKRRKNSRVVIQCKPVDLTKISLPEAPDLVRAMCTIWQLPYTAFSAPEARDGHPTLAAEPAALDAMHGRSPNRNGQKTTSRMVNT